MSDKVIDLHAHTTFSDGEMSPRELVEAAIKKNIKVLAITDHDTIEGLKSLDSYEDIKVVHGIELTTNNPKGKLHLLGLGIDINNEYLNKELERIHNNSVYYLMAMFTEIKKRYGLTFKTEDINELLNRPGNVSRPDIAVLFCKYGYSKTIKDAYFDYINVIDDEIKSLYKGGSYVDNIRLIKEAGGYAVVAHAHSLNRTNEELREFIKELVDCGLDGIEVYHTNHNEEHITFLNELASEFNLLVTGGSDYHGSILKPDVELGKGKGNLHITDLKIVDLFK